MINFCVTQFLQPSAVATLKFFYYNVALTFITNNNNNNIRQGGHHVGHWPTFLVENLLSSLTLKGFWQSVSKHIWRNYGREDSGTFLIHNDH